MKRACFRCRKEHRACKGGLPCRRCVALGSPERCHNNDDDDIPEQRKNQESRCSRQAKSPSITTPTTKQKPEPRRQRKPAHNLRRLTRAARPLLHRHRNHRKDPRHISRENLRRADNGARLCTSPLCPRAFLCQWSGRKKENGPPPRRKSTSPQKKAPKLCRRQHQQLHQQRWIPPDQQAAALRAVRKVLQLCLTALSLLWLRRYTSCAT